MKLYLKEKDPNTEAPITLELDTYYDEMLKDILQKFNDFRAPDNQVIAIYNQYGQKIPLTFRVKSDLTCLYECGTCQTESSDDIQKNK